MEFLNINDKKLKVTLSREECREYGIDVTASDFATPNVRRAIHEILTVAERECGFSPSGDRILIQILPLPDGRCELLVTRLAKLTRRDRATLNATEGLTLIEPSECVFRFSVFADLARATAVTYREGRDSDLYRDDLGQYYIHVRDDSTDGISELDVMSEFGDRLSALPLAVLSEYGTRLAKGDALDMIYRGEI